MLYFVDEEVIKLKVVLISSVASMPSLKRSLGFLFIGVL